jgi:hypothetical protein
VKGFICVSLGSSTVKLHDSLGSRRARSCSEVGFRSQNGHREECSTEKQHSFVRLSWAKGPNANNIHKVMLPVYGGKFLSRKAVHSYVEKFSQGRSKVAEYARLIMEVAETKAKRLVCFGFDAPVKRWDKCVSVGGYVEK